MKMRHNEGMTLVEVVVASFIFMIFCHYHPIGYPTGMRNSADREVACL